jgi:4-amino-4-deoxy-L-arabinose transferase-like glycosyltransferase
MLLILAAVLLWLAESESHSTARSAAVGLLLGYAYLTRPEGLLIAVVLFAFSLLLAKWWPVPSRRSAIVSMAVVLLVSAPYVVYLHAHIGRWAFSNKGNANKALVAVSQGKTWQQIWALDSTDRRIDFGSSIRETPSGLARRVIRNVNVERHEVSDQLGRLLKVCLLLGLPLEIRRDNKVLRGALPVMSVLGLPLLYLPLFYPESRYVFVAMPPVLMLACWQLVERFRAPWAGSSRSSLARLTAWLPAAMVILSFVPSCTPLLANRWTPNQLAAIGAWVRSQTDEGSAIMTSDARIPFYSERRFVRLPYSRIDRMARYARYHRVRHVLLLDDDVKWLDTNTDFRRAVTDGRLDLVSEWKGDRGATARLYELNIGRIHSDRRQ